MRCAGHSVGRPASIVVVCAWRELNFCRQRRSGRPAARDARDEGSQRSATVGAISPRSSPSWPSGSPRRINSRVSRRPRCMLDDAAAGVRCCSGAARRLVRFGPRGSGSPGHSNCGAGIRASRRGTGGSGISDLMLGSKVGARGLVEHIGDGPRARGSGSQPGCTCRNTHGTAPQ